MALSGGALSVWCVYLPCVAMVLLRTNEGTVPEWIEQRINAGLPGCVGRLNVVDRPQSSLKCP
jgi:hypothetical protein